jgi:glycosyltransferase involved in cell wall biosynthesis
LHQYRRKFYNLLRQRLNQEGINLVLIYGQPSTADHSKQDAVHLEWAQYIPSKIWRLGNKNLYWQPVLKQLQNADLVIVEQASKLLINYILVCLNRLKLMRVAFWGHGKNFQASTTSKLAERLKIIMSRQVHWWFAYNDLSAQIVTNLGFDPERITSTLNAIDTQALVRAYHDLQPNTLACIRDKLQLNSDHICLFIGGMYPEKRLPFLLDAIHAIRARVPDFQILFIGAGTDADLVATAAQAHPWIHYLGAVFGDQKVPYFAISKLLLMPGQVGLAILDAFALETPLVTTNAALHAPEIHYLENNLNGIMVDDWEDPCVYARAVIDLLRNETKRQALMDGCRLAQKIYTLEGMVENFTSGILQAINRS